MTNRDSIGKAIEELKMLRWVTAALWGATLWLYWYLANQGGNYSFSLLAVFLFVLAAAYRVDRYVSEQVCCPACKSSLRRCLVRTQGYRLPLDVFFCPRCGVKLDDELKP